MARVCDRCKKPMDNSNMVKLAGEDFEICKACQEKFANNIKSFKPKKGLLGGLLGNQ